MKCLVYLLKFDPVLLLLNRQPVTSNGYYPIQVLLHNGKWPSRWVNYSAAVQSKDVVTYPLKLPMRNRSNRSSSHTQIIIHFRTLCYVDDHKKPFARGIASCTIHNTLFQYALSTAAVQAKPINYTLPITQSINSFGLTC